MTTHRQHHHTPHELRASLEKHDPFWAPQLAVAGALVLARAVNILS